MSCTLNSAMPRDNTAARDNIAIIERFFANYLTDKQAFYALWADEAPAVITPFVTDRVAVCHYAEHRGWDAIRAFWDPIHDQMDGQFDWFVDEIIVGQDSDTIVVKSNSIVDVKTGPAWGNRHVNYCGRYIQIFKFRHGKISSFEEYYDTARLNAAYAD